MALAVLLVGLYTPWLDPAKRELTRLVKPLYQVTDWPSRFEAWREKTFVERAELQRENEHLQSELLILRSKLQRMAALAAENVRLRQLLNASEMLDERVVVAEVIGVSPNPLTHTLVLNRGHEDGIYKGQAVLDAHGLMGQVVSLGPTSAEVLLLTDPSHAVPVQVNRNGVRTIAAGTGDPGQLELRHVANTTDIREGDLLVSSGLGQRFPAGYPVAEVDTIVRDPGQPFATITATPKAQMNRARNVLLVFEKPRSQ